MLFLITSGVLYSFEHRNYSKIVPPDMAFVQKVSMHFSENKAEPIMVYYNKSYYFESISVRDAYGALDDNLRYMHVFKNIPLIPVMANIDEYSNMKPLTYADQFYQSELTPLNRWLLKNPDKTIVDFIKIFKIKHFYFMNDVAIPEFVQKSKVIEVKSKLYNSIYIKVE